MYAFFYRLLFTVLAFRHKLELKFDFFSYCLTWLLFHIQVLQKYGVHGELKDSC